MSHTNKFNLGDRVIWKRDVVVGTEECPHCGQGFKDIIEAVEKSCVVTEILATYQINDPTKYSYRLGGAYFFVNEYELRLESE